MISRRISLLPVAMHSWSSSWLDLFDSAADTVGPYHKSVPYFLLVKNPDFFHLSAHREVGPYHHKGVNLEWCKPGQVAPFSFSRLEEGRVTLRRAVGRGPSWKGVCLSSQNGKRGRSGSSLTTGFAGPGGQPPRAHNAPRGPPKVAGWVPGPAVESLSPSPGSLPVATLPVVLGSKYLRVDIAGQRFTGPRGGAAGRSRSRSLTEGPVTIECKGDTSFVFRDRSLSACIYHVRN